MAVEAQTGVFRTPHHELELPLVRFGEHEMVVSEFSEDGQTVLHVQDPLHEQPYYIGGEQSVVKDPVAARFIVEYWKYNARGLSTRQLSNTALFTTKENVATWSRLQHELSVAVVTAECEGTPAQIMSAAIHDAAHREGSHRTDDLLDGRGPEEAHEDVYTYLHRNGFVSHLKTIGVIDEQERFVGSADGLKFADICGLNKTLPDFTNQPGSTQSMETERLQYVGHEAQLWIYEASLVREALSHSIRAHHREHGDHVVFTDIDAARLMTRAQVRCATEHWGDPINDIIDELVMTLDRRLLTSRNPNVVSTDDISYFPGDVMYTSEEDRLEQYLQLTEHDPFASAIFKIAAKLAEQQRSVHSQFDGDDAYTGPVLPRWVHLKPPIDGMQIGGVVAEQAQTAQNQLIVRKGGQSLHKIHGKTELLASMLRGKDRVVDPWVVGRWGGWKRLSQVDPETQAYRQRQSQRAWQNYDQQGRLEAVINYDHKSLGLTPYEKSVLEAGFHDIARTWDHAMKRPSMPDDILTQRVQKASRLTRQRAQAVGRLATQRQAA